MAAKKKSADLAALVTEVNKKFGPGTLMMASDSTAAKMTRVPIGIPGLDYITGGGIPVGRFVGLTGNEMSGKSAVAHMISAAFQRHCRNCYRTVQDCQDDSGDCVTTAANVVWLDAEGTYDSPWAEKLGADNSSIYLIRPDSTERAVDVMEAMIRTGEMDLIVVDSVSALAPSAELEASAFDQQMGVGARIMNKAWRVLGAANNARGQMSHGVTILLINQFRTKLSGYGGNTTPGGMGQRFAWSINLEVRTENWVIREDETLKTKDRIGQWIQVTAPKNKTAAPHGLTRYLLPVSDDEDLGLEAGRVDMFSQILDYGVLFGIIKKSGSWYSVGEDFKAQGEPGFRRALAENEEIRSVLLEAIAAKMAARHEGDTSIPLNLPMKRG